jgi:hypothetical protein
MLTHGLQDHDQTNPPGSGNVSATLTDRLAAVGYPFSTAGESIYAFAKDPEHGHAGFEVVARMARDVPAWQLTYDLLPDAVGLLDALHAQAAAVPRGGA